MPLTITLLLSAGTPDPAWTLQPAEEQSFHHQLEALPVPNTTVGPPSRRPGYAGIMVRDEAGSHWAVYRGWVRGGVVARVDDGRTLERWLLETGRASLPPKVMSEVSRQIAPRA